MQGEIRVTVIATGFDRPATTGEHPVQAGARTAGPGVLTFPKRPAPVPPPPAPPKIQPKAPPPGSDVPEMEIPTFIRRQMD
jgi:cell division protein FtsZ